MAYNGCTSALLIVTLLSACGGGGGGDSTDITAGSEAATASSSATAAIDPLDHNVENTATSPNILLIISDDQGIDASAQYTASTDLPFTPVIDSVAAQGVIFDNAWATPGCSTTRATVITGEYGINSGVDTVPGYLPTDAKTLQRYIASSASSVEYVTAVVGKWHLAGGAATEVDHPNQLGIDYFAGSLENPESYYDWTLIENGVASQSTAYTTTAYTDLAIDWISQQQNPWFMWLAFNAPHTPYHQPPEGLYTQSLVGSEQDLQDNPRAYFLAAIEAMDSEIGRLLDTLEPTVLANTIIIFVGDNGSPRAVIDANAFSRSHSKSTLYEGGLRVPLVISGNGVTRTGEREDALVNTVDLYATVGELLGNSVTRIGDGISFLDLLSDASASSREYNYAEFVSDDISGWAVRYAEYKLIEYASGTQELYDLLSDPDESRNLISDAGNYVQEITAMENFAASIRGEIPTSSSGEAIDITDALLVNRSVSCADYAEHYTATATDAYGSQVYSANLTITVEGGKCVFSSNAIPNHSFNDGTQGFVNAVSEQNSLFEVSIAPQLTDSSSALTLQRDNAILLNGVKVDLLAAGCYGVADGKVGCNDLDTPWRYDPMYTSNGFNVDSHNAHTQPDGSYHYHGTPNALFEQLPLTPSPVVGFAADGFPIFGFYVESNGSLRKVTSSYRLKSGTRAGGSGNPGGSYDGTFRDDYEYIAGLGDLDECNGMLLNGSYAYYITDGYPYIIGCFRGIADDSFLKRN